jgi:DNA-binding Lrp family transcriptional regulator
VCDTYPKTLHKTLFALLVHSKRYNNSSNQFSMTYEQIAAGSNCSVRTAKEHVKRLEQMSVITVSRTLFYVEDIPYNEPNTYELNFNWINDDKDISFFLEINEPEEYNQVMMSLMLKAFSKNEWVELNNIVTTALNKKT